MEKKENNHLSLCKNHNEPRVVLYTLYLKTLNLGKWMEFLINTVKLMASTNAGSLYMTQITRVN